MEMERLGICDMDIERPIGGCFAIVIQRFCG
jgi:hypothetical protein